MRSSLQASFLAQRSLINRLNTAGKRNPLQAGFTLVELLIVVIIIGVLSAIAVPAFLNQQGRARINGAQTAVVDVARACAAAQVTNDQDDLAIPANVTGGPCPASGTLVTFTSDFDGVTTQAAATVEATGQVALVTCAAAAGWTAGTAPACVPVKV